MAKLVVTNSSATGATHELTGNWVTIGRADGNNFQIVEASISGRHCEVRLQGEELAVRDLLSTNGTFIGGQKISEGVLKLGGTLHLGDVELRLEASAPAESPTTSFTSKMLVTNAAAQAGKAPAPAQAVATPARPSTEGTTKKFQVLFVDDSLAFLDTFGSLCSEFSKGTWEIHTAASADRALVALQEHTADMVVLDIGMPMLDGLQLLAIITRRYPGLKVAVMTGSVTEAKRTDALANGAALFLEKPLTPEGMRSVFNVLDDLVSWTHREGFSGSIRQVDLPELVQMECLGKHSSILEIHNRELRGEIYIEDGAITHANVGTLAGEQAFYRLLSLKGGEFRVKQFKAPAQRTIEARWEFLLMDAARATDEETVLLQKSPPVPGKKPEPAPAPPAKVEAKTETAPAPRTSPAPIVPPDQDQVPGDEFIVVATYDGEWKPTDGPKPDQKPPSEPDPKK